MMFFFQKMMFIELPLAIFDIKKQTGGYLSTAVACFIEESILKFIFHVRLKLFQQ